MPHEREDIGLLLDTLYLEMFDLIEQQTLCRVDMEKHSNGGQLLLAKTRYIQGSQSVSIAQIPTENSVDFNALCRVVDCPNDDKVARSEYTLERRDVDKDKGFMEPMNWFGFLAPSSLRAASEQYRRCVQLAVQSANLQRELVAVMDRIGRLRQIMTEQYAA